MENNPTPNRSKKILYIALSVFVVIVIAVGTAYVLSRVSTPAPAKESTEVPLPDKLTKLYKDSGKAGSQDESLNNVIIQKSGTAGYSNAHARVVGTKTDDGSVAYFYQITDSSWHFFTVSNNQDKIACSDYNTDDLVNAYIGFTCLDTSTNKSSFVAHPQPVINIDDQPGGLGG